MLLEIGHPRKTKIKYREEKKYRKGRDRGTEEK
jgi:hypothetical protein